MEPDDRFEKGEDEDAARLPEAWVDTPRDPGISGGSVGTCRTGQGTMLYDRDAPGRYLIGTAVDLERMT
ncbi:hypothetical protein BRD02_05345 [Halobacteriales archaeon QS_8_69_73]|nr:MAG: hypothetical protein BRD02_05345 [Halobacteriales archaeon QS_8_69_73]